MDSFIHQHQSPDLLQLLSSFIGLRVNLALEKKNYLKYAHAYMQTFSPCMRRVDMYASQFMYVFKCLSIKYIFTHHIHF